MKTFTYILVSAALFLGAAGASFAQQTVVSEDTQTTVKEDASNPRRFEVGSFKDNWFVGIGGGVNFYMGEHDRQMKFFNRLAPAMDLYVGKWFTPTIGFRLAYSGGDIYGATNNVTGLVNSYGVPVATDYLKQSFLDANPGYNGNGNDYQALYWQKSHVWNIHVDFMVNMMNLIGGYKERVYSLNPYFGIGLARSYALKTNDNRFANSRINGTVGLLNTFRLGDALDLNVDVRGVLVPEDFEGELGVRPQGGETYESEGYLTASIGLAYKFRPRGWKNSKTVYQTRTVTVVDQDALNKALDRNKALEDALAEANAKTKTTTEVIESLLSPELYVVFAFDSSELTGEARVTLSNLAKLLKGVNKDVAYKISGYADQQTGSPEHNLALSEARAKAVYDFLVKEGVAPAMLSIEAVGGVDTMYYNDNRLSRAAILTLVK